MATHSRIAVVGAALLFGLVHGGRAAPPAPPSVVPYQGVLLDGAGNPRTGMVNLTLRIYDAPTAGTLVYLQSFTSVPLVNGVYSIQLGPTGSPTGTLTTSLAEALAGDLGAPGAARFLEVTVGGSGPLPRTQVLSVPYALSAGEALSVEGLPPGVVSEMFEGWNFDGGPPSTDPSEGTGDTDGDGIANFVDSDNDDDGINDAVEFAAGTDINVVSPQLLGLVPPSADAFLTTAVQVTGLNFTPGLTVAFGDESPAPSNITPTSFEVTVGPEIVGLASVQVTLPNGEHAPAPLTFMFQPSLADHGADVAVHLTVAVGPAKRAAVGGVNEYAPDSNGDGAFETPFALASRVHLAVGFDGAGRLLGLRCLDIGNFDCNVELFRDLDGDFALETGEESFVETILGTNQPGTGTLRYPSLATDPSGNVVAGYAKVATGVGTAITVLHDRDGNQNFTGPNERVVVTITPIVPQNSPGEIAVDASGRVAYLYEDTVTDTLGFAWDRSGDGDFDDSPGGTPEIVTVATGAFGCRGLAFDAAGPVAVWGPPGGGLTLARDANGDGDFGDGGEQSAFTGSVAVGCDVIAAPGVLAVADSESSGGLRLRIDRDDDGSFAPQEVLTLSSFPQPPLAFARNSLLTLLATETSVFGSP